MRKMKVDSLHYNLSYLKVSIDFLRNEENLVTPFYSVIF